MLESDNKKVVIEGTIGAVIEELTRKYTEEVAGEFIIGQVLEGVKVRKELIKQYIRSLDNDIVSKEDKVYCDKINKNNIGGTL